MLDLNRLASDLNGVLAKADGVAGKVEGAITTGGPEAVKVLEEVRAVLAEAIPALRAVGPLIGLVATFFPHANPPAPAAGQH
jgi:hypothetical protein